jgi:integrase
MSTVTLTFGDAIDTYIRDQQTFGRLNGIHTRRSYESVLRRHWADVGDYGLLRTTRDDVKRTLERWKGNSQYHAHSTLISFWDWAMQEGLRPDNPARQVRRTKLTRPSVYRLTRAEAISLMAACETPSERRVIYLMLLTGARNGELAALQVRHLQRPRWVWFSEDIAKGKVERWVPVLPELEPIIAEIVGSVRPDAFVIPTRLLPEAAGWDWRERRRAQPATRLTVSRIVKRVAHRAGIVANIHPHLLRHAYGDHIAKHAGLRVAQALMGHASVETTARIYVSRAGLDELGIAVQGFGYRDGDA